MHVYRPTDLRMQWMGRTLDDESGNRFLIGSASVMRFSFHGPACKVWLRNAAPGNEYNYISIVVDGKKGARQAIRFTSQTALDIIPEDTRDIHTVELYKETEAFNGAIIISKVEADSLIAWPATDKKKIEFIGGSISVGMSADPSQVACDAGKWYDQHNAYDAFGAQVAREMDMDYMLTGFSGIGIYRNSRADRPVMADIYPSVVLSPDPNTPRWDFKKFVPDIVGICLGANDFSEGEGATPRAPFDPGKFIPAYVDFIKTIHGNYPEAQIILMNTPMLQKKQNEILMQCLSQIKSNAEKSITGIKPLHIFSFSTTYQSGCLGHPNVEEHGKMAKELVTFLKSVPL